MATAARRDSEAETVAEGSRHRQDAKIQQKVRQEWIGMASRNDKTHSTFYRQHTATTIPLDCFGKIWHIPTLLNMKDSRIGVLQFI